MKGSRIAIVDEQPIARHALHLVLEAEGHEVVAEADNGIDAVQLARTHELDLLILDIAVPRLGGLAVLQRLAAMSPAPRVLVFTAQQTDYFAQRCLAAGAVGFVSKQEGPEALKVAVHAVLNGHSHFPAGLLAPSGTTHAHKGHGGHDAALRALSSRELMVLQMVARGMSNVAIADQLALSDKTISTYKIRLKEKLNVGSLIEMIDIARHHGLVEGSGDDSPAAGDPAQQQELALLRRILDALPYAICVRDPAGRMTTCNRRYLGDLGVTLDDVLGKPLSEGTGPGSVRDVVDASRRMAEASASGVPYEHVEVVDVHGRMRTVRYWSHPYVDADGRYRGYIMGASDLTDRDVLLAELRDSNARLEAADRARGVFLATVGSKIRPPLHNVAAMLDLALAQVPAGSHAPLEAAREATASVLALLDDLRELTRLASGTHLLAPEPVELGAALARVIASHDDTARTRQLQLIADTSGASTARVWIDPHAWRQILDNLVGNAVKFTDAGQITVRLVAKGQGAGLCAVKLEVEDTGVGIAEADQRQLFEPFAQFLDHQRMQRGGSGLGLALCKRLVEQMEGRISVRSRPGAGSCFTVELSLTQAQD
ncbi:ATP-binding protein [Uliginosibacterium sp. H1]|uniref:ATP-binding protein n=1 Tax=Uliginosibacterium sp. H1 TaxID=3114757 RepID=UPI002E16CB99|nr:ATP-binding protein [Uliginosibacterium sp. H1]